MGGAQQSRLTRSTSMLLIAIIPSSYSANYDASLVAGLAESIGSANGIGTNSRFYKPEDVDLSPDNSFAIVGDSHNHVVRHLLLSTTYVTTLAGVVSSYGSTNGIGTNAKFYFPNNVAISPDGSFVLVTDAHNYLIRKIIISTASVSTVAGVVLTAGSINGFGTNAQFYYPIAIDISSDGLFALVADGNNHLIRKIIISTAEVSTLAGSALSSGVTNGIGTNSRFLLPRDVSISLNGLFALIADGNNHLIRQIIISTATVTTLAGGGTAGSTNGIGTNSKFNDPFGISVSPDGLTVLIGDQLNHLIRQIIISTATVTTLAGGGTAGSTNGIGTNSKFNLPMGLDISLDGSFALIADRDNHAIRKITLPWTTPTISPSRIPTLSPTLLPSTISPSLFPTLPPSLFPTLPPSLFPTLPPSLFPTLPPSLFPTPSPTPFPPTIAPSLLPTITFQPTMACPPGHYLKTSGDLTSCLKCEEGSYSTLFNEKSCQPCDYWTGNDGRGNSGCPYTTAKYSSLDALPIFFCVLYGTLSLICFGLVIHLGGSPTVFLNFLLITTDQVTDILYTWYSLFANPLIFWSSVVFCTFNLFVPMVYFLWYFSFRNSLIYQWQIKISESFSKYDRAHGGHPDHDLSHHTGWIFHAIHGWNFDEIFPFSLIFLPIDGIWILLRILIVIITFLTSLLCQVLFLLIGVIFSVTKLLSLPMIETWFWSNWNQEYPSSHPRTKEASSAVYNSLVLLEIFTECIPQLMIQSINTSLVNKRIDSLTVISMTASSSLILFILYHFWYKHKQLRREDPTYTKFDISRIPKFDMYEKFMIAFQNQRKDNYSKVPIPSSCLTYSCFLTIS
jgi:hypothetical protein